MSEIYDIKKILELIPHRYPFVLLDRVIEFDAEKVSGVGIKCVTMNEQFFTGHFPTQPVMPGVLILEALAQMSTVVAMLKLEGEKDGQIIYLMSMDKVKFRKPVIPGDVLHLHSTRTHQRSKVWSFDTKAYVDDKVVCEAQISAIASK